MWDVGEDEFNIWGPHLGTLSLTPDFKSRVLGHLYGIEKFGLRAHQQHRDFASLAGLVHHVDGHIAYALGMESAWAEPVRERWRSILDTQGRPLG
ncbi:hypothetical protein [Streptomyces sp. NPDC056061]|uniref:hypothetical protein n=1 Tax=Streptomyces sp. NPDC056061 TaxID=3345700 RepID=UPI0035DB64F0